MQTKTFLVVISVSILLLSKRNKAVYFNFMINGNIMVSPDCSILLEAFERLRLVLLSQNKFWVKTNLPFHGDISNIVKDK